MVKKIFCFLLVGLLNMLVICDIYNSITYSRSGTTFIWPFGVMTFFLFFLWCVIFCCFRKTISEICGSYYRIFEILVLINIFASFFFWIPKGTESELNNILKNPTHICSGYVNGKNRRHDIEYTLNGKVKYFFQDKIDNDYVNSCHLVLINEKYRKGKTIVDTVSYLQELYCKDGVPYSKLNKIYNLKFLERNFINHTRKNVEKDARIISCIITKLSENVCFYESTLSDDYIWASANSRLHKGDSVLIEFNSRDISCFNIFKENPSKQEFDLCLTKDGITIEESNGIDKLVSYKLNSTKVYRDVKSKGLFFDDYTSFMIPIIEVDTIK